MALRHCIRLAILEGTSASAAMSDSDDKQSETKQAESSPIQVFSSEQSIHDAMRQQIAEMLANSDLTEEQKQQILVSMSCPCCGGGGVSLSIKLKD
jgi:tyrosyl-tRNA synthetase